LPQTTVRTGETIETLQLRANRLRAASMRATTAAGSGHPTTCMSAADLTAALFFGVMRYDPKDPNNPANDRFVLSKGHAAPILYAAFAESGAVDESQLNTLRQIDSPLEGHPTANFEWSEAATGSLGQGLSIGFGMAMSGKFLEKAPYRVFVMMGDGECAEGSVWEAANLAAHYKLDNLVAIVDVNGIGQSQRTMFGHDTDQYVRRFEAFGWEAEAVDGHDMDAVLKILTKAANAQGSGKPFAVIAKTFKGQGVSFLADKDGWHGKPLKPDVLEKALAELGNLDSPGIFKPEPPPEFKSNIGEATGNVEAPTYEKGQMVATRNAYGDALVKLGKADPRIVAMDCDTKNSTFSLTFMEAFPERFFELFIAEQNLAGAAVGLARRGFNPFISTFACFLTRAYDFVRMAAIGKAKIRLVGSHSGVSIGEDGPSQMGLEDLAMMRTIEGSIVLYPSDAVSTERLTAAAAAHDGISYMRTSRPKTAVLYDNDEAFPVGGSKVVRSSDKDTVLLAGAGITLHESLAAADILAKEGISARVMDLYSVKPIDGKGLKKNAAETGNKIVITEDHYESGGIGEAAATALSGIPVNITRLAVRGLPRSGKPADLLAAHSIDARAIAEAARRLLG
jgi:transketolase